MFIAICLVVVMVTVILGFEAIVVVLQAPFVGKAIAQATLEVPFRVRFFLEIAVYPVAGVNFCFRVPSA